MTSITIQGTQFEVPDAVIAGIQPGYVLSDEGEASAFRQVKLENLRNNFASKVKAKLNGSDQLSPEDEAALRSEFTAYAASYKFGVRGEGKPRLDPITREMHKLAREDITKRYNAKHGEKPTKELLDDLVPQLLDRSHDDYAKRARAIIKQRDTVSTGALEELGL